jgi:hypothetical protein
MNDWSLLKGIVVSCYMVKSVLNTGKIKRFKEERERTKLLSNVLKESVLFRKLVYS